MIRKHVSKMATTVAVLSLASCATHAGDPDTTSDDPSVAPPASSPSTTTSTGTAPDAGTPATKITIKSTQPLALVAYREVSDPVWHAATEQTSGKFTAKVRGPYMVTAVCQAAQPGTSVLFAQVWRAGRTLDDAHELDMPFSCAFDAPKPLPEVTGTMIAPSDEFGTVALGSDQFATQFTGVGQFPFSLLVPKGTYTTYAFTDEQIAIRHDLAVNRSLAVPEIDLASEGSAYVFTPFTAVNADPSAFQHAVTRIETAGAEGAGNDLPILLTDQAGGIEAVPNEIMTTDNQTISVQADVFTSIGDNISRDANVSVRQPWRLGEDPTFVEPDQITNVAWSFDGAGQLMLSWQALPMFTIVAHETRGFTTDGNFADDFTELSPAFVAATGATSILVDTSIPGFETDWMVDYNMTIGGEVTREVIAQDVTNPTTSENAPIFTSDITDTLFPAFAPAVRAAVTAPPHMPRPTPALQPR